MNDVQEKVLRILRENTAVEGMNHTELLESDFQKIGINSLNFIKIVVAVEETFGIEFDDNDLNYDEFRSVKDIVSLIGQTVQG